MHSVTSNAVAKALNYSATEVNTGIKWADGKPVYTIVWSASNLNIGVNEDVNITNVLADKNVNHIISLKGSVYFPDNNIKLPVPNDSIGIRYNVSSGYIYIRNGFSSSSTNCTVLFVVEYTKTTD